jgi:hypothetical protein
MNVRALARDVRLWHKAVAPAFVRYNSGHWSALALAKAPSTHDPKRLSVPAFNGALHQP